MDNLPNVRAGGRMAEVSHRRNAWFAWFAAVAATALLAGCTSGRGSPTPPTSTPVTSRSSSPTTSAATSPTPTVATTGPNVRPGEKPPVLSARARQNTPQGADEYARYWIATLDWAYATTDSTLARTVYANSCTGCARFLRDSIDKIRRKGQSFRGGRLGTTESTIIPTDHHFGATAFVDLNVDRQR
ncbi:MAG: DUF6318 family protein [Jatrophihabitantaceae bacterium]